MAMQSDAYGLASGALIKYEYDRLESKRHIRFMTIKPWLEKKSDEEPVRVHLERFPVLKCPRYQALSYTWVQPYIYYSYARQIVFPVDSLQRLCERAFGFAMSGRMVLVPAEAEVAHHICLLYAIQVAFVLRQGENGGYRIVGACYVHEHFDWDTFEKRETPEPLQDVRPQ